MVESLQESERRFKKDVPEISRIKNVVYPAEFPKKFKYHLEKVPCADYYVEYEHSSHFGSKWLIEASKKELRTELRQLELSAEEFKSLGINIDNYLVVLDSLSRESNKKYKLVPYDKLKALKYIKEKIKENKYKDHFYKILNKEVFVTFRSDFKDFKK